eukprot:CAMPEP_0117442044 /NCGR_PEP_ID=MMETSP0759-20121206/3945_1 /TAXON_ID=63605 /ORGANISM="Percolomonas cosmopolitus, Strain WS" /LENGTH=4215 /DNA_ID=CAMNT_0005233913 /DNA_START=112 /DNA_END=12759 /DNA_ORIENTATION=-
MSSNRQDTRKTLSSSSGSGLARSRLKSSGNIKTTKTGTKSNGSAPKGLKKKKSEFSFDISEIYKHDVPHMKPPTAIDTPSVLRANTPRSGAKRTTRSRNLTSSSSTLRGSVSPSKRPNTVGLLGTRGKISVAAAAGFINGRPSTQGGMNAKTNLTSAGFGESPQTPTSGFGDTFGSTGGFSIPPETPRVPYLADILQTTPQSPALTQHLVDTAMRDSTEDRVERRVAPDDTEPLSQLRTGEDAVAFFAKAGKTSALKVVYLNRAPRDHEYDYKPYDLVVVSDRSECHPEYFTMSATGVVHVCPGQPTEFMSLSDYMKEAMMFRILRKLSFFKNYLIFKYFKSWYLNSRKQSYNKKRAKLYNNFFGARKTFAETYVKVKRESYKLTQIPVMNLEERKGEERHFLIDHFNERQEKQRTASFKEFELCIDNIEQILIHLCKEVTQRARVDENLKPENVEQFLMKGQDILPQQDEEDKELMALLSKPKSKSMVQAQEEERLRRIALKKAKDEANRLSDFIRACDWMATESLVTQVKDSMRSFLRLMRQQIIMFKISIEYDDRSDYREPSTISDSIGLQFIPEENDLADMFRKNSEEIIACVARLARLLQMRSFKLYFEQETLRGGPGQTDILKVSTCLRQDEEFQRLFNGMLNLLHQNFDETIQYSNTFDKFVQWFKFAKTWDAQQYNEDAHTADEFLADLEKVNVSIGDLKRIQQVQDKGVLFVESREIKKTLQPMIEEILQQVKNQINVTSREMCVSLFADFQEKVKILRNTPAKLSDFSLFVRDLNTIKKQERKLMLRADEVDKMYELAKRHRVRISNEDLARVDELKQTQHDFIGFIVKAEQFKEKNIFDKRLELKESVEKLDEELQNLIATLRSGPYVSAESNPEDILDSLDDVKKQLDEMKKTSERYSLYKSLFNEKPEEWKSLKEAYDEYSLRRDIWQSLYQFEEMTEQWDNTDKDELDGPQVEEQINEIFKRSHKLHRKAAGDDITTHLKHRVKTWKDRVPIILMISNKDMLPKHWQQVFKGMNQVFIKNSTYTLRNLSTLGIYSQKDLVSSVSAMASGEADLIKMLDQIETVWGETEVATKQYRDYRNTFILGSVEEIMQLLEDHQVQIQTMIASPFVTGIKARVEQWDQDLSYISELIDEWLNCQKNWMYLEFIFGSDDIKKQLPREAGIFTKVDENFKSLMVFAHKTKKIIQLIKEMPDILEKFQSNNENLDEVQKSLEDFLETKRAAFPRFYFLSNDELIEILSQTREPRAVQPHLSKCFDSIKQLKFKDEGSIEIVGMYSGGKESEYVTFSNSVYAQGNVESWLQHIEDMMQDTLYDQMRDTLAAYNDTPREEWLFIDMPAQCILTTDQIIWTRDTTEALLAVESGDDPNALKRYMKEYVKQIEQMVQLVRRPDLTYNQRMILNALLVVDVHAQTVLERMIEKDVRSPEDFEWTMQLRFYWDDDVNNCVIKQTSATFVYGYEYLGNQPRLVITPLTDRCYMTITGALNMQLGASPQGPAGTGKTETVKDLSKALARQTIVFNCSEGLKVKMMAQMFAGLAQAGAWACFDEFNRIDIEVLSVIAQYMRIIQRAIINKEENFIFEDRDISLNMNYGVFITMNPGYAGRTELPDNLKALFRPVAMMIPDYALIAEIMLYAEGFDTARTLAQKMVQLFKLSSEQLSKQDHYDFGMRAVKSILVMAGSLKRGEPDLPEDIVLIRAMRDANVPKFLKEDVTLFMALIQDLFPGMQLPDVDYGDLQQEIETQLKLGNYQVVPAFVGKILQLHETMNVRHGVMLVGLTGSGKTVNYQTLQKTLTSFHTTRPELAQQNEAYRTVKTHVLNPKAVRMQELYGDVNELTHEWHDGLIAKIAREAVKDKSDNKHWIVFDGPVDALWIENMNTVLDDNKMLCLTNGERIKIPASVSLLFEVQDLAVASPATVSRCGMVYMEEAHVDGVWRPLYASWLHSKEEDMDDEYRERIKFLVENVVGKSLDFLRDECNEYIASENSNLVQSLLSLMDSVFKPHYGVDFKTGKYFRPDLPAAQVDEEEGEDDGDEENKQEEPGEIDNYDPEEGIDIDLMKMVDLYFIFALIWSVGGNLDEDSRNKFSIFLQPLIQEVIMPDFPTEGDIYDYYVHIEKQEFRKWKEIVGEYAYDPHEPYFNIMVPTVDSTRLQYLMKALVGQQRHMLINGVSGAGKTVVIQQMLRDQFKCEDPNSEFVGVSINFSAQTSSRNVQDIIEDKFETKRKTILGAPAGKNIILLIDDINMPTKEEYGAQPPIELVRQTIGGVGKDAGFYDLQKLFFKHVTDTVFVAACAPPGGGRTEITPRVVRHFHLLNYPSLGIDSMHHIFFNILSGFLSTFSDAVQSYTKNVVDMSIDLYLRIKKELLPRPSTSHYTFNLRDLGKLFQGVLQISHAKMNSAQDFVRLWVHEGARVFRDRLINNEDRDWFVGLQKELLGTHMPKEAEQFEEFNPLFGSFMVRDDGKYEHIADHSKLEGTLTDYLEDFKVEKNMTDFKIVFFESAIEHLSRICRILRQPRGNALLVGVGGSGRHVLTRLAAFMNDAKCVELEITRNFKRQQFLEALKEMIITAGCDDKPVIFLLNDTQIVEESMLEDIHNLLNTGEIAGLIGNDEMQQIIKSVAPKVKKANKMETRETIYRHFVHLVRENLHIVLCMSPIGDSFRNRIRQFPSLITQCTIDWYDAWPDEALFSVSNYFLHDAEAFSTSGKDQQDEMTDMIDKICKLCVYIQTTVRHASDRFLAELRRHNYTTPTSYLELINLYIEMYQEEKERITAQQARFDKGLNKLGETNQEVEKMKVELTEKQPILDKAVKDTNEIAAQLEIDKKEAAGIRVICVEEEKECTIIADKASAIKAECQADLDLALPAFNKAVKAVDSLNKDDIYEIKAFKKPPPLVQTVLEAVCVLLGRTPNWKESLVLLANVNFLKSLKTYDKDNIPKSRLKKLKKYISMKEFDPALVEKVNTASKSLCMWVIAINTYSKVAEKIEPKKQALAAAEAEMKAANETLREKQEGLRQIEERVESLEQKYTDAKNTISRLEAEIQQTKDRLDRAEKLLSGLSGERVRWQENVVLLSKKRINLIGDILISAGCVSYLGPFTSVYRKSLVAQWLEKATDLGIPVSSDFNLTDTLVDKVTIRQWINKGLPTDDISTENALFVTKGRRWPLLVDPQTQANKWIRNQEKSKGLKIIKAQDTDVLRKLEAGIRVGLPCLLENVGEELDPALEPILLKQTFRQGGRLLIRLGDQDVDYNPNFRLYMTTKLPNPHYMPEVCIKVTIINFTVTLKGLEDQLLADVVAYERPELEKQKNDLVTQIADGKAQLKECEDRILELLFKESEILIVDDIDLIKALNESKVMSENITQSVEQAETTAEEINLIREKYRPVATRGSILYFVVSDMTLVDPMYQNALQFFKDLFNKCLEKAEKNSDLEKRLRNLMDYSTDATYQIICRGLFEKDKLLFSFLIAVQILRNIGTIIEEEWGYFLRGNQIGDVSAQPPAWLPRVQWREICGLEKVGKAFENLSSSFLEKENEWRSFYEDDRVYEKDLPEPFNTNMSEWHRLMFLRCIRPEKMIFGISRLVRTYLGPKFTVAPEFNLHSAFGDTSFKTPIVFVLSSGADPQSIFDKFSKEQGKSDKVLLLSLGQGQGVKAQKLISRAQKSGEWVMLQNCHLCVSWMPDLERIVEETAENDEIHKDYRLWLTSMPSEKFPVPVLQSAIKLTNEPPKGLKANVARSFAVLSEEDHEATNKPAVFKKVLFGLVFFHALIQERRKFGSLGWNIQYEWNTSDLEASMKSLRLYIENHDDTPWQALRYIIGVINYGGRVTDFLDLRCLQTILERFFAQDIFNDDYFFTENKKYHAPLTGASLEETQQYISQLPAYEEPEVFGLHPNANVTFQQKESDALMSNIINIQPRSGSGVGGKSNDEIVLDMLKSFQSQLPAPLERDHAHPDTFKIMPDRTMNCLGTFLGQEIDSFNILLKQVGKTLAELEQAVQGFAVMSAELEGMYNDFLYQKIPLIWANVSYPSLKRLNEYFADLIERVAFLRSWIVDGPPKVYWISCFFFPQGFMTSVLQTHSRKHQVSIDTLCFQTTVLNDEEEKKIQHPESGAYICGTFLEGSGWDKNNKVLVESQKGVLHVEMPTILLTPVNTKERALSHEKTEPYECPLYKTSSRAGVLSTTGVSTNFVLNVHLPTGSHDAAHWIERSTCLLCMKE